MNNESIKTGGETIEQLPPTLLWEHGKQVVWWKQLWAPQKKFMKTVIEAAESVPETLRHTPEVGGSYVPKGKWTSKVLVLGTRNQVPAEKGKAPDWKSQTKKWSFT